MSRERERSLPVERRVEYRIRWFAAPAAVQNIFPSSPSGIPTRYRNWEHAPRVRS